MAHGERRPIPTKAQHSAALEVLRLHSMGREIPPRLLARATGVLHAYAEHKGCTRDVVAPSAPSYSPAELIARDEEHATKWAGAIPGTHQAAEYERRLKSGKMGTNGNSPMSGPLFAQVHANGSRYASYGRTGVRK